MLKAAVAVLRKIWRQICRQIFRQSAPLTLPVPTYPRGRQSGAVPGVFVTPPELPAAVEDLIRQVLERRWLSFEVRNLAVGVIARFRELVGDLPASANHHHSESYGLLRHSLEVTQKMLDDFDRTLATDNPPNASAILGDVSDRRRCQYLYFMAGLCHDLGKLMDMDIRDSERRWSPLKETYGEFCRKGKAQPVLTWRRDRKRGGHALLTPLVVHHVLTPADLDCLGRDGLAQFLHAMTGTHNGKESSPLAEMLRKFDQENVDEVAPDWMLTRPDSKVAQFIRALRVLIENGELSVSSPGAPVYVTGDKAAIVVPLSVLVVREFLKRENIKLPPNHRLYDLLAQAEVVEADANRQCVKRIRVPGKHGPVELSAVIFQQSTIISKEILPTLPKVTFEIVPEEPKQSNPKEASENTQPSAVDVTVR